jgi:hypothetical protein
MLRCLLLFCYAAFLFAAFPPPLAEIDDLARFFMLTVAEEAIYG